MNIKLQSNFEPVHYHKFYHFNENDMMMKGEGGLHRKNGKKIIGNDYKYLSSPSFDDAITHPSLKRESAIGIDEPIIPGGGERSRRFSMFGGRRNSTGNVTGSNMYNYYLTSSPAGLGKATIDSNHHEIMTTRTATTVATTTLLDYCGRDHRHDTVNHGSRFCPYSVYEGIGTSLRQLLCDMSDGDDSLLFMEDDDEESTYYDIQYEVNEQQTQDEEVTISMQEKKEKLEEEMMAITTTPPPSENNDNISITTVGGNTVVPAGKQNNSNCCFEPHLPLRPKFFRRSTLV